jgi:predicted nucleic acid-binding protein
MRVYVETNFLLEIALLQEQHQKCEEIVDFCGSGSITLALPAFCISEAYFSLVGKRKRRERFTRDFSDHRLELTRSARFKAQANLLESAQGLLAQGLLIESTQLEDQEFYVSLDRLLAVVDIIPLNSETLRSALSGGRSRGLQLPDAIVLASVLAHLDTSQPTDACFLNRDRKDFNSPYVAEQLATRRCKILFSFEDGADYLRAWQRP